MLTRVLLVLEFVLGVLPPIAYFIYHFPVAVFWVSSVVELVFAGTANLFTVSVAVFFVAAGLGLASLSYTIYLRLFRNALPGRALLGGLLIGMTASIGLLSVAWMTLGFWIEFYVYGAPLIVAAHHLFSTLRQQRLRLKIPSPAAA